MGLPSKAEEFLEHGVLLLKGALNDEWMSRVEEAFDSRLNDVISTEGQLSSMYPDDEALVFNVLGNSIQIPIFRNLIERSPIADFAQDIFGNRDTWYWEDQLWLKQGGDARRTPWHQDTAYLPIVGNGLAVFWIPLESLPAANVLEVVRGSHRGPLYNAIIFDPQDETKPLYEEGVFPRMPDIQKAREDWDIFSADMDRGDILVFHPKCLHGGAPVSRGQRRRTMTFRFFDSEATYQLLPPVKQGNDPENLQKLNEENNYAGFDQLKPGDPAYLSPIHHRVRPWQL